MSVVQVIQVSESVYYPRFIAKHLRIVKCDDFSQRCKKRLTGILKEIITLGIFSPHYIISL
jgi:hypothetical protein